MNWPLWVTVWTCDLCGYVIQGTLQEHEAGYIENDAAMHRGRHGADWKAYMAIGAQRAAAASQGEGG